MMKQTSLKQKSPRTSRPNAFAGPQGVAITPPAYGLDVVDNDSGEAMSEPGQGILLPVTIARPAGAGAPVDQRRAVSPSEGSKAFLAPHPNHTGLPDTLKSGIEHLSGLAMDDVRVHYNSPQPAQLHALAYTQGTDIHVGPGQETHLAHEAWHVVQQKQGRVRPTLQAKKMSINNDEALEREADVMGAKASSNSTRRPGSPAHHSPNVSALPSRGVGGSGEVVQAQYEELYEIAARFGIPIAILLATATIWGVGRAIVWATSLGTERGSPPPIEGHETTEVETTSDLPTAETKPEDTAPASAGESRLQGVAGDCLYTAVSLQRGNAAGNEGAIRQIATDWLVALDPNYDVFDFGDRTEMLDVVANPQQWAGDAGDLSAVVLAHSLQIRLRVVTPAVTHVFDGGGPEVTVYYHNEHYTTYPVIGIHDHGSREVVAEPKAKAKESGSDIEEPVSGESGREVTSVDENILTEKDILALANMRRSVGSASPFRKQEKNILTRISKVLDNGFATRKDLRRIHHQFKLLDVKKPPAQTESGQDIVITYETESLRAFIEGDPFIEGTIDNIVRSGFGGSVGTGQKLKVGEKKVKHQHVEGGDAIAFRWTDKNTLHIAGYGKKKDSAPKGSGGYDWDTKPK